jgi:hypothetical protein
MIPKTLTELTPRLGYLRSLRVVSTGSAPVSAAHSGPHLWSGQEPSWRMDKHLVENFP